MSKITYFQRYASKENAVTNNVMLLFSRLYAKNPELLQRVLLSLSEEPKLVVGPSIDMQKKLTGVGIPDAVICQPGFLILAETKVDAFWDPNQIARHLVKLVQTPEARYAQVRLLLLLGKQEPARSILEKAREIARGETRGESDYVSVVTTTFEDLVDAINQIRDERDYEMVQVLDDFENYASDESLLPTDAYTLRIVGCSKNIEENRRLRLYYGPRGGYRAHQYLGLYAAKSVLYIGKVVKVADIDLDAATNVLTVGDNVNLTRDEEQRFRDSVQLATAHGWQVDKGCRFWFVDEFKRTDYKKSSSGGMLGNRYIDVRQVLSIRALPEVGAIAQALASKTWE